MAAAAPAPRSTAATTRVLVAACFLSNFDRFTIGPVLFAVAAGLQVSLGATAAVASGYAVAYGLSQPLWGMLSDRFGRVRILYGALIAAAVTGVLSALMPSLWPLIVVRTVAGACFGAIVPTALTYIGDTTPVNRRQGALSDVMSVLGIGTALATTFGGVVSQVAGWRVVFALPAAAAAVVAVMVRRLPEPAGVPVVTGGRTRGAPRPNRSQPLVTVLRERWAYVVMGLGFVEGAVLLGCLTFLAPALQDDGLSAARAGAIAGLYGVGILIFTRVVKRLANHRPAWALLGAGGLLMGVGYLLAVAGPAAGQTVAAIAVTGVLLGAGWAFMHSTLQTWATTVVPEARGTGVAMFAAALFMGSAVASALAGPLADGGDYGLLFGAAALTTIPLTAAGVLARSRYTPRG
jgi:predicted MFS family arabinose efflux permease